MCATERLKRLVEETVRQDGWICVVEGDSVVVPFSDVNVRIQISEEPEDGALDRPPVDGCWEDSEGILHRWREDFGGSSSRDHAFEFRASSDWHRSANPGVKPYTPCEGPAPKPEPRPRDATTRKWMRETGRHLVSDTILWRWDEEQGIYQTGWFTAAGDVDWVPSMCQDEPLEMFVPADGLPWGDK